MKSQIGIACNVDIIIQLPSENILLTLKGHQLRPLCLAKLNTHQIVSGSLDKSIKIWDIVTGNCLKTLLNNENVIKLNKYQIVSDSGSSIKIWDI